MGRNFLSPPNSGIYMSLLLRPQCRAEELMHLTCAVGVGVCDAVERICGVRPGIKWINDLVFQKKKLGGILTELSLNADGTVNYAVIGIGINISSVPVEVTDIATALSQATDTGIDYATVAAALIDTLSSMDFMDASNLMERRLLPGTAPL